MGFCALKILTDFRKRWKPYGSTPAPDDLHIQTVAL